MTGRPLLKEGEKEVSNWSLNQLLIARNLISLFELCGRAPAKLWSLLLSGSVLRRSYIQLEAPTSRHIRRLFSVGDTRDPGMYMKIDHATKLKRRILLKDAATGLFRSGLSGQQAQVKRDRGEKFFSLLELAGARRFDGTMPERRRSRGSCGKVRRYAPWCAST